MFRRPGLRLAAVLGIVFALAFVVRAYWATRVQSPLDAVYSDMGSYVERAELLLAGKTPSEPRVLIIWPWGTHTILAGLFELVGRGSREAIGLAQAFVGALVPPCVVLLTRRFVAGLAAPFVAGLIAALWHPNIIYVGFFSSEIWFTAAIVLATVFLVRHSEQRHPVGGNALIAGVFLAVAFAVRPQILLTLAIAGAVLALRVAGWALGVRPRRPSLLAKRPYTLLACALPLVVTMFFSRERYRSLTGEEGLNSGNGPLQLLFGQTEVVKVEAKWTNPKTKDRHFYFFQSQKTIDGPATDFTTERWEGFIEDAKILDKILERRLAGVPLERRLRRAVDNVTLLAVKGLPWPEVNVDIKWRRQLQQGFQQWFFVVLALAAFGALSLRRHPTAGLLIAAQLITIVLVAAIYVGELRFRTPYDPFLIVVAVVGLWNIGGFVRRRIVRWRRRASARRPAGIGALREGAERGEPVYEASAVG